ncbi:unnamed protein product [Arctogadus glacialis]
MLGGRDERGVERQILRAVSDTLCISGRMAVPLLYLSGPEERDGVGGSVCAPVIALPAPQMGSGIEGTG